MPVAEKLAVSNAAANTTALKSLKLLNASNLPPIWSYSSCMTRSTSTASVKDVIWRAAKPYLKVQDID